MRTRVLLLTLGLVLSITAAATAQNDDDPRIVGIQEAPAGGFDVFSYQLQTGEFQILAHLDQPGISQHCLVEARNNNLCVFINDDRGRARLLKFGLAEGEVNATFDLGMPHVLDAHYDPSDGSIYAISRDRSQHETVLWQIDPGDGNTRRIGAMPGEAWECSAAFDHTRGLYFVFGDKGEVNSIDVHSGEVRPTAYILGRLQAPHYVMYRQSFMGIFNAPDQTDPHNVQLALFNYNNRDLYPLQNRHRIEDDINVCGGALDYLSNNYIMTLSSGQFRFYDLAGTYLRTTANIGPEQKWIAGVARNIYDSNHQVSISGRLMMTNSGGCANPETMEGITGVVIHLDPLGLTTMPDQQGRFYFRAPPGHYRLRPELNARWDGVCPESDEFFTVEYERNAINDLKIILQTKEADGDDKLPDDELPGEMTEVDVEMQCPRLFSGQEFNYTVTVRNNGDALLNGFLVLNIDPSLEFINADQPPLLVEAEQLVWRVEDMPPGTAQVFNVEMKVPVFAGRNGLGPKICAIAELKTFGNDHSPEGGSSDEQMGKIGVADDCCQYVWTSYDPNDITVRPTGFGDRGLLMEEDRELSYTIHFQNLGKAPAIDVVILDTLDADLDLASLEFVRSTHEYSVSLLNDNILEFRFENIQLPGKEADKDGSHGMILYRARLNSNLPPATEIHNRAAIYFDLNEPVLTNTVLNTVAETATDVVDFADQSVLELRSHSNGLFVLHADGGLDGRLSVHSILGTTLLEQRLDGTSQTSIDLRGQPSGRYLLRVEHRGQVYVKQLVFVR